MMTTKHLLLLAALSVLGAANSYADLTQVDGVYQIGTPADLVAFSALVNEGQTDANAVLLCDIGMSNTTGFNPIGTAEAPFKGTFDGKGHRIMNLQIIAGNYAGFIGCVVGGATIRNLILDETCSISGGKRVGLVGGSNGEGIVTMECLGNEATITGSGANAGGIFGGNTSSKSTIIIERCYNAGNVTGSKESGAISGWIGSSSLEHSLAYCYNIGTVTGYKDESQYVYRGSPAHIENIFSTLGTQGTIVSNEAVASGELTWLMNGQTFLNPKFFQTIGVDSKPLFDSTHEVVIKAGDAYSSFNPADGISIKDACNFMIDEESQRAEETVASQALLDEYVALLQSWQGIETYEAFVTAYTNAQPLKQQIEASVKAYKTYIDEAESALAYLAENQFNGAARTILETYLNTYSEASETYPNGTYPYIIEKHLLSDEAIVAETAFLRTLYKNAAAENIVPGASINIIFTNINFADGLNGWTTDYTDGSVYTEGTPEVSIAQGWDNTYFTLSQTVAEIPNGVYVIELNGLFRPAEDATSTLHAGQVSLNDNINFLMTPSEDSEGAAPTNSEECVAAFSAGRYMNYAAVEVTDATLTIGLSNPGTGLKNDWVAASGIKVYYMGNAEEASASLDKVLGGYVARAQTIINFVPTTDGDTYHAHPNFSAALKTKLTETISACGSASTGAEKIALVNTFSNLFKEVYACRNVYIEMIETAEEAVDVAGYLKEEGLMSEERYTEVLQLSNQAWNAFTDGTLSAEEAEALTKTLKEISEYNYIYKISTGDELIAFATKVNDGYVTAKAELTADIDMNGVTDFQPIGTEDKPFQGIFDGKGHRIKNLQIAAGDYAGFIGCVIGNATIRNLIFDSSCSISGHKYVGLVGGSNGEGTITMQCLGNEANITSTSTIAGGVFGSNHDSKSFIIIDKCYNTGNIQGIKHNGALAGWIGTKDLSSVTNCFNIGTVTGYEFLSSYLFRGSAPTMENIYSTTGEQGTIITPEAVTSGELAYLLGWGQELGKDAHPTPFSKWTVYKLDDGTYSNTDGTGIEKISEANATAESVIYDLMGRRISQSQLSKGLYIVNGKKILKK